MSTRKQPIVVGVMDSASVDYCIIPKTQIPFVGSSTPLRHNHTTSICLLMCDGMVD